jgi:hypothetical protein
MVLGLVMRSSGDFKNTSTINSLYKSFVRPQLEYGIVIWNNSYQNTAQRIEAIQKKYIRFFFRKINWPYDHSLPYYLNMQNLPPYKDRCEIVGIEGLSDRRDKLYTHFMSDLLCSRIDSSALLSKINFNAPAYNTRNFEPIYTDTQRTTTAKNSPLMLSAEKFNLYTTIYSTTP